MSGISAITSPSAGLAQLLSQPDCGASSDPTPLNSLVASGLQAIAFDGSADSSPAPAASPADLQTQVQSAITAALQSAEQSGGSDLKNVVYNSLVQVLSANGIDPKTFQSSSGSSGSGAAGTSVDPATGAVLSQVLAAVTSASAASDPAAQLPASQNEGTASSDLYSLLTGSQTAAPTSADGLSPFLGQQNNSQDLLGFLYDSGQ